VTSTGPPALPIPLSDLPAGLNATLINGFWYYYETKEGKVSSTLTFIFLFFFLFFFWSWLSPSGKRHCDAPRNRPQFGISTF
jgi:hypothetical protein